MVYINQNVKLRIGGRKAPKISLGDLEVHCWDYMADTYFKEMRSLYTNFDEKIRDYYSKSPTWIDSFKYDVLAGKTISITGLIAYYGYTVSENFCKKEIYEEMLLKEPRNLTPCSRDLGKVKFGMENWDILGKDITTTGIPYFLAQIFKIFNLPDSSHNIS